MIYYNFVQVRVDSEQLFVCQRAFSSLHGISISAVQRICRATSTSVVAPKDMRGKHANRPLKISPAIHKQVKEHIKSFPIIKSHYSWQKNKLQQYLSPLLSIMEMHRLYVDKYEGNSPITIVKYHYYSKFLMKNLIFHLGIPNLIHAALASSFKTS